MSGRKLYKVLMDGKSCHGGNFVWSLPKENADGTVTPGEWHHYDGQIICCERGFHLTTDPTGWWKLGCEIFQAEAAGAKLQDDDKSCHQSVRLVRRCDEAELNALGIFSAGHHNPDSLRRVIVCGDATVHVYGNATVRAFDNAKVHIYDNGTAKVYGNATVHLWHDAAASVYDNATAYVHNSATARVYGKAAAQVYDHAMVKVYDNATADVYNGATARLYENATALICSNATAKVYGKAMVKVYDKATVINYSTETTITLEQNSMAVLVDRSKSDQIGTVVAK